MLYFYNNEYKCQSLWTDEKLGIKKLIHICDADLPLCGKNQTKSLVYDDTVR